MPVAVAQRHHDTLPFFSDEGFRHFLPAWLRGAPEPDTDLDFFALQELRPPPGVAERAASEGRVAGFSPEQRSAIAAFLDWRRQISLGDSHQVALNDPLTSKDLLARWKVPVTLPWPPLAAV